MKTEYRVKHQLSSSPCGRAHRTLTAAIRDLRACERAARAGGDCQGIGIVAYEDGCLRELTETEMTQFVNRQ